ncbi:MAG: spore coat associated protein CotJA [Otoolea sp.]|nr:spore coat associated protein CotJA [Clostridium sp.]MDY5484220.1 spore coat associated protein CotJA [Clostridium sp.]
MNCNQESYTNRPEAIDAGRFPIGMGYVPMQRWRQPYSLEQGFRRGTIFPELDLPFMMGRCR